MRDLDPLVGRIDVVAAQKAGHVVARVMHGSYDKRQSGLCLTSGMGMSTIRRRPAARVKRQNRYNPNQSLALIFCKAGIPWLPSPFSTALSLTFRRDIHACC